MNTNSNAAITETNNIPESSSKKSYARPDLWQCNISKKLREMGMNYISQDGKERAAREIRESCPESCMYECQLNFDSEERKIIHQTFWSLNKLKKHEYYDCYVERAIPKRKRVKHGSRRSCSFRYFFPLNDRRLQVCQKFFMNTLGISTNSVYWYFKKGLEAK